MSLMDKAVLEIGAGTGLLSIVASLLGKFHTIRTIYVYNLPKSSGELDSGGPSKL